jgi:hypothetical protein
MCYSTSCPPAQVEMNTVWAELSDHTERESRIVFQRLVTNEIFVPLVDERCLVFDRVHLHDQKCIGQLRPSTDTQNSPSFPRLTATMRSQDDIIVIILRISFAVQIRLSMASLRSRLGRLSIHWHEPDSHRAVLGKGESTPRAYFCLSM